MLFIVCGVPRAGKSTVRQKMLLKGVSGIGTDDLTDVLQTAAPDLGVSFGTESTVNATKLWPFILALGAQFTRNHEDYLIEGDTFDLDLLKAEAQNPDIKICFLGHKSIDINEKLNDIRKHAKPGDWTFMHTDEELLKHLEKYKLKSEYFEKFCNENGFKYFDSSENFLETLDEVAAYLSGFTKAN